MERSGVNNTGVHCSCHAYTSINHVITRNTNTNHVQRLAHTQYPDHYICGRVWWEVEEVVGVGVGGVGEVFKALYDGFTVFPACI